MMEIRDRLRGVMNINLPMEIYNQQDYYYKSLFKESVEDLLFFNDSTNNKYNYILYLLKDQFHLFGLKVEIYSKQRAVVIRLPKNLKIVLDYKMELIYVISGTEIEYIRNLLGWFEECCRTTIANAKIVENIKIGYPIDTIEARKYLLFLPYLKITNDIFSEKEFLYSIVSPTKGCKVILDEEGNELTMRQFEEKYENDCWNGHWYALGTYNDKIPDYIKKWRIKK